MLKKECDVKQVRLTQIGFALTESGNDTLKNDLTKKG